MLLPDNFKSLTDMAIEQNRNMAETDLRSKQAQELQRKMQQEDKIKQRLAETYKTQQEPTLEQLAQIKQKTEEESFVQSQQSKLEQMQKQANILMEEGDIANANIMQDNVKDTQKALFDYTDNKKKEKAGKLQEAAQIMSGVTDQASYVAAINATAEIDPNIARGLVKKYGPRFNQQTAVQLARDSAKYLKIDEQIDNNRAEREYLLKKKQDADNLAQRAIDNALKRSQEARAREMFPIEKASKRANIFATITGIAKPTKEKELPASTFEAVSKLEKENAKKIAKELDMDSSDPVILEVAGKAKVLAVKEKISYEEAVKKLLEQSKQEAIETTEGAPSGVPKEVWNVMTPEEKKLWQK